MTKEDKNDDLVDGKESLLEPTKQLHNHQDSNTASLKEISLEGTFLAKIPSTYEDKHYSRAIWTSFIEFGRMQCGCPN